MSEPLAYAIDFGTSNSAIAIAYPDHVEIVPSDPATATPESLASIIYLHRLRGRSAGQEAVQQFLVTGPQRTRCGECELVDRWNGQVFTDCKTYKSGGFCMDSRLLTGLKSHMSETDLFTHSWAVDFLLTELVSVVLSTLKKRADRMTGRDIRRALIGHPVAFEGTEGEDFPRLQKLAEETLIEAARSAGFEEVALFPEPSAAVIDETLQSGVAVATDFGGGTFDVAVIEFGRDEAEVVALQGAAVGGERFDALLFDHKVAPVIGTEGYYNIDEAKSRMLPGWFRQGLRTLGGTARLLSDRDTAPVLRSYINSPQGQKLETVEAILFGGQAYAFHKAIELAKIELSERADSSIRLNRPGIQLDIPVSEAEFSQLLAPDMELLEQRILLALQEAGVSPSQVDLVIRTGGSSRVQAFQRLLETIFGAAKIQERHLFNTVVSGLGSEAQGLWAA